ncbi:Uu.00g122350.m01.CDS01 [Anthostomella pinea]|uniref:Uu.00g122350.m01.CDS01 n=1 Tax=Anthostomella pinea TaxID=933095 RepID=A0AAI8VHV7_9PEZI|nr:Uu.00g122350.m01.CDS01 [Anthostomella pinea]
MCHFVPVDKLDVDTMVDAFINRVFSLHGTPEFITSDRGSQFVSHFWHRLAERLGSRLKPSSAYHPSTNGQTEILNAISIEPPSPRPLNLTRDEAREWDKADKHAELIKDLLEELRHNMAKAQEDYAHYSNVKRSDAHVYKVDDMVWLSSENIVTQRPSRKLSNKWLGPFAVSRTYKRACALELDGQFNGIFPVFHHSLLRPIEKPKTLGQVEINKDSQDDQKGLIIVPNDRGRLQKK